MADKKPNPSIEPVMLALYIYATGAEEVATAIEQLSEILDDYGSGCLNINDHLIEERS